MPHLGLRFPCLHTVVPVFMRLDGRSYVSPYNVILVEQHTQGSFGSFITKPLFTFEQRCHTFKSPRPFFCPFVPLSFIASPIWRETIWWETALSLVGYHCTSSAAPLWNSLTTISPYLLKFVPKFDYTFPLFYII